MLHIILLILKIIGFLILGILALAVLLTAVILLAPFVYRLDFSANNSLESAKGCIRFHWLMHLISGEVSCQDGTFNWHIRAAWKKFGEEADGTDESDTSAQKTDAKKTDTYVSAEKAQSAESERIDDPVNRADYHMDDSTDKSVNKSVREPDRMSESSPDSREQKASSGKISSGSQGGREKTPRIYERFRKIPEKIKYTFRRICDKISTLKKKKERIAAFLRSSTHQNAFSRLIKELKRLFHFLKPSDASVDLEFGFSDPAYTGYTLAGISMIYPMIGEYAQIKPDFEHKVLKGNVFIKGRIRILYGVIFAWNMLWDKNVRTTYRHIRKFRL